MIYPPYLQPGDRVAIVAPARKISPSEIDAAVRLLRSWQLEVVLPEHLFDSDNQFAGPDNIRALTLQQQLDDPSIRAILCARGGYGTARIIDQLDFSHFRQCPKWLIGYSDITVLHSHIHQRLGIATLHATMPINIPTDADRKTYPSTESLRQALFGAPLQYALPSHPLNRSGSAQGQLVGGNLSILYSLCGSPSDLDTDGKILFIEDLDEYLYHIDRMITNLKRCGRLAHLAALVVGQMSDMHDNTIPFGATAEQIILRAIAEYHYPVCFNFPAGHNGTDNHALIMGASASLSVNSAQTTLTIPNTHPKN